MFTHLASYSKRRPAADPRKWSSLLSTSATPGTSNLQLYLAQAQLPPMALGRSAPEVPLEGHKAHRNALSVRAEYWRRLKEMTVLPSQDLDADVLDFVHSYIPSYDLGLNDPDEESGERLTVPCGPGFRVSDTVIGRSSELSQVSRWVMEYPLATVQRTLHAVLPHTQAWSFSPVMADPDDDIVTFVTWDRRNPDTSVDSALAVMIQPPWIASPADLEGFVNCQRLPSPKENPLTGEIDNEYNSKERMWAKLWDLCARRGCQFFVVTTYWGWVFGAFSRGRSKGFVTAVKEYDASAPTILQILIFWTSSAMGLNHGWSIPEIAEPVCSVNIGIEDTRIPPDACVALNSPSPSESTWEADSQANLDVISSTDSEVPMGLLLTPPGLEDDLILPPQATDPDSLQDALEENIIKWQLTGMGYYMTNAPPGSPFASLSEVSSAITVSSASSTGNDHVHIWGDWITARPRLDRSGHGHSLLA